MDNENKLHLQVSKEGYDIIKDNNCDSIRIY